MAIKILKSGPNGNAYAILGIVKDVLRQCGRDDWNEVQAKMTSGDYENLCKVATEATFGLVEFIDERPEDQDIII